MKILLITDQVVHINNQGIWTSVNFSDIVKRLSVMGEVHMCIRKKVDSSKSTLLLDSNLNGIVIAEHIHFVSKSNIWPSKSKVEIMKQAIKEVDLVVGYVPSLNAEVGVLLAHKLGKKYMALMVACPWDGLWNQDWKRKLAAPYRFLLNRRVLLKADYALYVTNFFLQRRYPTRGKTIGVSNVVLKDFDDNILEKRLHKIDEMKDGGVIKIVTTAMLDVKYKGQRFVMKALKKLKDMGHRNYHYYLIGGGDPKILKRYAERLGIIDQIHIMGKIPHNQVFSILDDMDIYIHPSLQEGLPRSLVEAMSRALPCIGANTAAIPELIAPQYIVKRKSSNDIINKLLKMDKEQMRHQAMRNYIESKNYDRAFLDNKRSNFYLSISSEFEVK